MSIIESLKWRGIDIVKDSIGKFGLEISRKKHSSRITSQNIEEEEGGRKISIYRKIDQNVDKKCN